MDENFVLFLGEYCSDVEITGMVNKKIMSEIEYKKIEEDIEKSINVYIGIENELKELNNILEKLNIILTESQSDIFSHLLIEHIEKAELNIKNKNDELLLFDDRLIKLYNFESSADMKLQIKIYKLNKLFKQLQPYDKKINKINNEKNEFIKQYLQSNPIIIG